MVLILRNSFNKCEELEKLLLMLTWMHTMLHGVIGIGIDVFSGSPSYNWCYDKDTCKPNTWSGGCSESERHATSPINLPASIKELQRIEDINDFRKTDYTFPEVSFTTVPYTIRMLPKMDKIPEFMWKRVLDGSTSDIDWVYVTYKFEVMDIHWGNRNDHGSEHTIELRSFPAEIHLVYHRNTYNSTKDVFYAAHRQRTAILVIAFFLDVVDRPTAETSHFLQPLIEVLDPLENQKTVNVSKTFKVSDLFDHGSFYAYYGAFTAPNCESTIMLVKRRPVIIPSDHLSSLRRANFNNYGKLGNNFRSLQPNDYRKLLFHTHINYT